MEAPCKIQGNKECMRISTVSYAMLYTTDLPFSQGLLRTKYNGPSFQNSLSSTPGSRNCISACTWWHLFSVFFCFVCVKSLPKEILVSNHNVRRMSREQVIDWRVTERSKRQKLAFLEDAVSSILGYLYFSRSPSKNDKANLEKVDEITKWKAKDIFLTHTYIEIT